MVFEFILIPLILIVIIGAISLVIYYQYFAFKYWENRGIPCDTPRFPAGNLGNMVVAKQHIGEIIADLYKVYKNKGYKHGGLYFFNTPVYLPLNLNIIKSIFIRDFQYFTDRAIYYDEEIVPVSANITTVEGERWKYLRHKLTPTFTSGKLKMMFQILVECANEMKVVCDGIAAKNEPLDAGDISSRYTFDVNSSCSFGFKCNSLRNPQVEFLKRLKRTLQLSLSESIIMFFGLVSPKLVKLLPFPMLDEASITYMTEIIKKIMDDREKYHIKRNDFLQLLMQLKNQGSVDVDYNGEHVKSNGTCLTINEVLAQAFAFLMAGFETSATTISFSLCELAINSTIQDKLREEVLTVMEEYGGKLTYEGIMKMTYIEKVVQETLRKYPVVPHIGRKCVAEYKVPTTNLMLQKGTIVFISVLGLHNDPEYYPNPELFDPERFNEENKVKRPSSVFLPFGDGPRNCIGYRFAKMQIKICLAVLISRYNISLNKKTQFPLKFLSKSFTLSPAGSVWLDIQKINTNNNM